MACPPLRTFDIASACAPTNIAVLKYWGKDLARGANPRRSQSKEWSAKRSRRAVRERRPQTALLEIEALSTPPSRQRSEAALSSLGALDARHA